MTINVDGADYPSSVCSASGGPSFDGQYHMFITSSFNSILTGPVRAIGLTLIDSNGPGESHEKIYPVSLDIPGAAVTYNAPVFGEQWVTEMPAVGGRDVVGSGSVTVTALDPTAAGVITGYFEVLVIKDGATKKVKGQFENLPIELRN